MHKWIHRCNGQDGRQAGETTYPNHPKKNYVNLFVSLKDFLLFAYLKLVNPM